MRQQPLFIVEPFLLAFQPSAKRSTWVRLEKKRRYCGDLYVHQAKEADQSCCCCSFSISSNSSNWLFTYKVPFCLIASLLKPMFLLLQTQLLKRQRDQLAFLQVFSFCSRSRGMTKEKGVTKRRPVRKKKEHGKKTRLFFLLSHIRL